MTAAAATDRRQWALELSSLAHPRGAPDAHLAVPSLRRARIVLPVHGRSVRTGLRRLSATHGVAGRAAARGLGVALSTRPGRLAAERLPAAPSPTSEGDDLATWLAPVLGHPVHLGWLVSPPRATRKPVYLAFDPTGDLRAVVKVGVTDLTSELVRAETAALEGLATTDTGPVRVPAVRHHGVWSGRPVLVQEALPPLPPLRRPGLALSDIVDHIARTGAGATTPLAGSAFVDTLLHRLERLDRAGTTEVAAGLRAVLDDTPVRTGAWHGDLNPGNLEVGATIAQVWDWERYGQDRPVGFDVLHHTLHDRVHRRGEAAADAARGVLGDAADLLAPLAVEPAAARPIALCYLAELAARYVGDDQAAHGWALARPQEWLVPLLHGSSPPAGRPATGRTAGGSPLRKRAVLATRPVVRGFGRATAAARRPPDFLIVGAQRCGTTSMFKTIVQHPDVVAPLLHKGVHYFDTAYEDRSWEWYLGHFPRRDRRITGESSPYYLFHPLAAERIAAHLPDVRAIVLLRDPVERAYSAHAHERARGFEDLPFEAAIDAEPRRIAGEEDRIRDQRGYRSVSHQHHAYLARGEYVSQLRRLEDAIGRDQILVVDADDFFADPGPAFAAVSAHLGLAPAEGVRFGRHNARPRSDMPDDLRAALRRRFEAADEELAGWWGRVPSWRR